MQRSRLKIRMISFSSYLQSLSGLQQGLQR
jgi:hypothetical protein